MSAHRNASCSSRFIFDRREALLGIGGTLAAQHGSMAQAVRRVGILGDTPGPRWDAFRKALADLGYIEGKNLTLESRYSLVRNPPCHRRRREDDGPSP
jgi:hypothetical protein